MADRSAAARERPRPGADDRAVSSVVGKVLEVGLVVLFVTAITATLFGGAVPAYRTAAGDEVAERTLAGASQRVQQAIPPNGTDLRAIARVDLPDTIRGRPYEVRVDGRTLVLDHPRSGVDARARLALPPYVVAVSGHWSSGRPARVVVESVPGGVAVRLVEGSP